MRIQKANTSWYGVASSLSTTGTNATPNPDTGLYNIAGAPLYFVRSGYVSIDSSKLRGSGQYGYDWSSRAYSNTTVAYYLYFLNSGVNPSSYSGRYIGFPLRCLAS